MRAQPLGLMNPCSCGFYARSYTLIHRSAGTAFRGFFRFMNDSDGTPPKAGIAQRHKAPKRSKRAQLVFFSTSQSTGVERWGGPLDRKRLVGQAAYSLRAYIRRDPKGDISV